MIINKICITSLFLLSLVQHTIGQGHIELSVFRNNCVIGFHFINKSDTAQDIPDYTSLPADTINGKKVFSENLISIRGDTILLESSRIFTETPANLSKNGISISDVNENSKLTVVMRSGTEKLYKEIVQTELDLEIRTRS